MHRAQWADYFTKQGTPFVFFSAKLEAAKAEAEAVRAQPAAGKTM